MRKVLNYSLFFLLSFVFIINFAKADSCNYKEQATLNKEAKNIKITSELPYKKLDEGLTREIDGTFDANGNDVDGTFAAFEGYYFSLYITNLTDNFKIELSEELLNDNNQSVKSLTTNDAADGVIHLYTYDLSERKNLSITILSTTVTCSNKQLIKKTIKIPKYNEYSATNLCEGHEDLEICQPFYYTNKDEREFVRLFHSIVDKTTEKKDEKTSLISTLLKYWWVALVVVVFAGAGFVIYMVVKKRRIV